MHEEHASCARKECVSHLQGPALTPFSFPCSEIVDLTQDDEEKRKKKVVKEATRKNWVVKFPWIECGCMVLNQLYKKVSQIEIGRLEDGIDDGEPEFDFAFCADDGSDDDGDDGDDDGLWLEDEEGSDEEDEYIFALDPDSVAVVQVEGELVFGEHLILPITNVTRYCLLLLFPRPK